MYTKLFSKILDSSVWLEPTTTRIVWITLLAAMDQDGFAQFSAVGNLAGRARLTVKQTQEAVAALEAPDPESNDPANDGRRIERVPGGWMILNAAKYREIATREHRREQVRSAVKTFRQKNKKETANTTDNHTHRVIDCNTDVINCNHDCESLIERIRAIGKWRNANSSAAEHALVETLSRGADPDELFKAMCRIHEWTQRGVYCKELALVIPRWQEPADFWQHHASKPKRADPMEIARKAIGEMQ